MIDYEDELVTYDDGASVDSSFLKWVGYDRGTLQLYVEYLDRPDEVRAYFSVPQDIFDGLVESDSPGGFYNSWVRGRFSTRLLMDFDTIWSPLVGDAANTAEVEDASGFVTVGYADDSGIHFSLDSEGANSEGKPNLTIDSAGDFTITGDLDTNAVSVLSGFGVYRVDFTIGTETGHTEVFATDIADAFDNGVRVLGSLNVAYEITGVNKV